MAQINEQFILTKAPNAAAVKNGRTLSGKGSFTARQRTADDTLYWAECAGSGKTPYRVSIDFSGRAGDPVCRCSCPSRQFPCKHAIGLMFEIAANKPFDVAGVPEDIAAKREKLHAKQEKAAEPPAEKPKKKNTAAQKKKFAKQLEGLDQAQKMVEELLNAGVGTLAGSSAAAYEKLAKDLGSYYLTGPQTAFLRIAYAVREMQRKPDEAARFYAEALRVLIALNSTIGKSRAYLNERMENPDAGADSTLFETLGGVWRLEDLRAVGAYKENAKLLQLSMDVSFDAVKKEYAERGWWIDLDTGEIAHTLNLRPAKALKYVKAEDSCFPLLEIPVLYQYPAAYDRRVRWEDAAQRPAAAEELQKIIGFAAGLPAAVKAAKDQFKNTLAEKYRPALLRVSALGTVGDTPVLADAAGNRIVLRNRPQDGEDHATVDILRHLPIGFDGPAALGAIAAGATAATFAVGATFAAGATADAATAATFAAGATADAGATFAAGATADAATAAAVAAGATADAGAAAAIGAAPAGCAIFGLLFYDEAAHAICFHPYSAVTPGRVIRLLY